MFSKNQLSMEGSFMGKSIWKTEMVDNLSKDEMGQWPCAKHGLVCLAGQEAIQE